MTVQIAFYRGSGSWVNRLIKWFTDSRVSHCEIVINGRGYTPKRGYSELFQRNPKEYQSGDWDLIDTGWPEKLALGYVMAHMRIDYDLRSLIAHLLPIHDSLHAQNCSEFLVNLGSYCNDPRFHNRPSWRYSPADVLRVLKNG